ncbi:hypothetical protein BRAS3843_1640009 [Bradyrhizobium sp. STM 3843]|nr:hypothetical protein BRAS3843_1640009 [Bradyrhizobium sp. STM 3843]
MASFRSRSFANESSNDSPDRPEVRAAKMADAVALWLDNYFDPPIADYGRFEFLVRHQF